MRITKTQEINRSSRQTHIYHSLQKAQDNKIALWAFLILTFLHSGIQVFKHSRIQAFKHSRIQAFSHSSILAFKHSCIQAFSHSCILAFY